MIKQTKQKQDQINSDKNGEQIPFKILNFEAKEDSDEKQDMKIEIIKLNSKVAELNEDVQALLKENEKLMLREKDKTKEIEKQRHTIKDLKEKLGQANETLKDN